MEKIKIWTGSLSCTTGKNNR